MAHPRSASRLAVIAELDNPSGFTTTSLAAEYGLDKFQAQTVCHNQCSRGYLFASKSGHRTVRYFGRQEWADAHQRVTPLRTYDSLRRETTDSMYEQRTLSWQKDRPHRVRGRASWAPDAPTHIPDDVKFTRGPAPAGRVFRTNTHAPW